MNRYEECSIFVKDDLPIELPAIHGFVLWVRPNKAVGLQNTESWQKLTGGRSLFADPSDDFLHYWPREIIVSPEDLDEDPAIVDVVERLLCDFWDVGRKAVAVCEFEDELSYGGGEALLKLAPRPGRPSP